MFFPKSVFIMQKVTSRRKVNAVRKQKMKFKCNLI